MDVLIILECTSKMPQHQSQSTYFYKISGGSTPLDPPIGVARQYKTSVIPSRTCMIPAGRLYAIYYATSNSACKERFHDPIRLRTSLPLVAERISARQLIYVGRTAVNPRGL